MSEISIKWDFLGAKLAALSDDEQALFFKGFAFELSKYETQYAREAQMLAIQRKLSGDVQKTLEETLPCLWYKEK